jgi:hypothetical protein
MNLLLANGAKGLDELKKSKNKDKKPTSIVTLG